MSSRSILQLLWSVHRCYVDRQALDFNLNKIRAFCNLPCIDIILPFMSRLTKSSVQISSA